jgi:xanthine dehydrogenase YagR molybdenum-binding subunit
MADYHWPPADKRSLIGKSISRVDGPSKASGRATYSYDVQREGMLFGRMVLSPHAHAKITSIDTSAAEKMPGVKAVAIFPTIGQGFEVLWAGQELVAVAAETDDQARDAARAVRIEYDVLPHSVADVSPDKAGSSYTGKSDVATDGDADAGFQKADVTHEGEYGNAMITHCCLESHGQVTEWQGDQLTVWASTQGVSSIGAEYAKGLNIPETNVRIITPVMGGGFGSKFQADRWGVACATLSKKSGRPVKMMLERDHELMVAGARPSLYAKVKVGATKDGTLTAWSSESWGTAGGGGGRGSVGALPYVFQIPYRRQHTPVSTNVGPIRAWRAPNHPQYALITMGALDDLAAKLNMDPLQFFLKNISMVEKRDPAAPANAFSLAKVYTDELNQAAELMDWQKKWHPRGDKTDGPIKRGVGLSIHTWSGRGHASNCNCTINPDGSVSVSLATQDLGVGTRTIIGIVAAETFGLPLAAVTVNIGDSKYPPSGASGGSTTSGGVSSSTRLASTNALNQLLAKVAPSLDAKPEDLEAAGGNIRVAGNPSKSLTWKQACAKLGTTPINVTTSNQSPEGRALMSQQVGGAQIAEVSVDTETGVVRVEKLVAVQDCGLVLDVKTAESQVYGALIMGVCYALYEEKIMDQQTGRMLNADMEFYKLAGINDIGELVVHMMTGPGYDDRGVIGLSEPPTVSPGAAIANAVANAIGVRVPTLPMTPDKVLAALGKGAMA